MSANDNLRDEAIRHALHAEKYSRGLANKIVRLLNSADADLVDEIAKRLARIEERGVDVGPATTKRLQELLTSVRNINDTVYRKVAAGLTNELHDLTQYEAGHAVSSVRDAIGFDAPMSVPTATYLKALVEKSPIDGHLLSSWTDNMSANRQRRVEQAIRSGLVQGQTTDKIVQTIAGTRAAQYADGLLDISRRSAQTLVLTATSTIANNAREAVYLRNPDLIRGLKWVSTLDTRTSSICQSRDGHFYQLDEPHPSPPAHPRCRSVLVPVTKKFADTGIDAGSVPAGARASMDGQLTGKITFGDWIAKQSEARQNEVFGVERAQLFRDGKVAFKDLYRENGEYKSLAELKGAEGIRTPAPAPKPAPTPAPQPKVIYTAKLDQEAREYVLKKGRETGNEHLVGYETSTGAIVERKEGKRSSVSFSPELTRLIRDPASNIVLHHNHPASSSLSLADLQVVTRNPGAKAIYAHGHNGSLYYAEPGKLPLNEKTVSAVASRLQGAIQQLIFDNTVTVEEAQLVHNHLVWLRIHRLEQIIYRADLAGSSKTAFDQHEGVFTALLESLDDN